MALLIFGAISCTVYTPLQPSLPGIRGAGQVELRGSLQPSLRAEAGAAYSPANHLLLTGMGSWRPQGSLSGSGLFRARLAEAGVGTYWPAGPYWTLVALGGYGWGQAARQVNNGDILFNYRTDYFSRYTTQFGQFGALCRKDPVTIGLGYRLTQVRFRELRSSEYLLPLDNQLRHEPFFSVRFDVGAEPNADRWQAEIGGGLSLAQHGRGSTGGPYDPVRSQVDLNRGSAWLVSAGVVFRPIRRRERGAP